MTTVGLELSNLQRFFHYVKFTDTCWLWLGGKQSEGYGHFHLQGQNVYAHRYAYEFCVGPIPNGLTIDHLCRVRACVNPDHLEPVTTRENTLRGIGPTAKHARATHCPSGHLYLGENLILYRGWRSCRECHNAGKRRRRAGTK